MHYIKRDYLYLKIGTDISHICPQTFRPAMIIPLSFLATSRCTPNGVLVCRRLLGFLRTLRVLGMTLALPVLQRRQVDCCKCTIVVPPHLIRQRASSFRGCVSSRRNTGWGIAPPEMDVVYAPIICCVCASAKNPGRNRNPINHIS